MSKQGVLFDVPVSALTKPARKKPTPKKKQSDVERGCEFCPSNKKRGITKIMGHIRGRAIALFAQSPGPDENDEEKELVGPSGQLWWDTIRRFGLRRKDFDIQNVMRCFPADWEDGYHGPYLKMRPPTTKELHCCSLYTDKAIKKLEAKQIVLLGAVAAKQFLKTKSLPKSKSFWSEKHGAKIYLLDHPSFFLRGAGGERLKAWKRMMQLIAADRAVLGGADAESMSDPYHYLRQQNYVAVTTLKEARAAQKQMDKTARKKRRFGVDIENAPDGTIRCCGFSPKPGTSYVFVVDAMPDVPEGQPKEVRVVMEEILANPWYGKAFHFGCTDEEKLVAAGYLVRGYTHDTYYSEYLRFSDLPSYGLDTVAERRFPQFAGYANIVVKEMLEGVADIPANIQNGSADLQMKFIHDKGHFDIRKLSLATLVLYNGADCDVTKRVEIDNRKQVPQALMRLYIDLGVLLHAMEKHGPMFDYEQHEKLDLIYPHKTKMLRRQCRKMVRRETKWFKGNEDFNPGAPMQVQKVLYSGKRGFGLEYPFADSRKNSKPNTQKATMLTLAREHPFPRLILDFRSASKVKQTNKSYRLCAEGNGGRLRTKWNATGTRTGRLSSSGDKDKKASKQINLQNIKKDAQVRNMCIADPRWKQVYEMVDHKAQKFSRVRAYWHSCDAGERKAKKAKKAWKAPAPDTATAKQLRKLAYRIHTWLEKHMPDFKTFLVADFGQVEVRVAAQMARDKNLLADCKKADIHTTVGVAMTGWDADKIANDDMTRTLTKNVHFAILFGSSEDGVFDFINARTDPDTREEILAEYVRRHPGKDPMVLWKKEMTRAYRRYFKRYGRVKRWIEAQREFAEANEFVTTMFGMIQTLNVTKGGFDNGPSETGESGGREAYWGNQCLNGPIQGTAHQLLICALVNLIRKKEKYAILGIPPMEVHDALYFVVNVLDINLACTKTKYLMEKESLKTVANDFPDIDWTVPIVIDLKAGVRLGTQVKVRDDVTPGGFVIDWYRVCKKQMVELDTELLACAA